MTLRGKEKTRDPLFHIVKRTDIPMWKGWLIRGLALVAALVVCGVIPPYDLCSHHKA